MNKFFKQIRINKFSPTPKHLQISESIASAIKAGYFPQGFVMPSINDLSCELSVARGTIEKSYQHLKCLNVIHSYPGKGYYVPEIYLEQSKKVCLLFNNISTRKEVVFNSFVETIGKHAVIDLFIYNNSYSQFKRLLDNSLGKYHYYVILPHFVDNEEQACEQINKVPKDELILLDRKMSGVTGEFGAVYENFERDIFDVLSKAHLQLCKYRFFKLLFPENSYYPKEIIKGFTSFCKQNHFNYKVINSLDRTDLNIGDLYINLADDDLELLVAKIVEANFKVGRDIGIISYNETPLKKYLLTGMTTISTNFQLLGELAAQLILDNSKKHIQVPFEIKVRSSI